MNTARVLLEELPVEDLSLFRQQLRDGAVNDLRRDAKTGLCYTVVERCACAEKVEFVRAAVEAGADIERKRYRALCLAAESDHLKVVEYLTEQRKETKSLEVLLEAALNAAASAGQVRIVKHLVEHCGADVRASEDLAIRHASERQKVPVVEYLLQHGAEFPSWFFVSPAIRQYPSIQQLISAASYLKAVGVASDSQTFAQAMVATSWISLIEDGYELKVNEILEMNQAQRAAQMTELL